MLWINCEDDLPDMGDYNVLVYFDIPDAIDIVHVEDYFGDITNGVKDEVQLYTKWYINARITHWMYLPETPRRTK